MTITKKLAALASSAALIFTMTLVAGVVLAANPAADLDQCANDPLPSSSADGCNSNANQWVNGNLGASKSVYFEGDSIPYRMRFSNLTTGPTHTVVIEWDTTKSGKHALDYIDDFNESVLDANPCLGVSGCNPATPDTEAIPDDPQVTGAGVTPLAGVLRLYGGTITNVGYSVPAPYQYPNGTGFVGDKSARLTISFTSSVANPVLAWGGHISTRVDWTLNGSAVAIPGSPYHTRLVSLDGAGGNQDRSLSAAAVIFPGFIHIVKNTTGGDATFDYTASPSPLTNFSITTSGGTGHKDFDNIINFTSYTVAESTPPSHWQFDSLSCSWVFQDGGSFSTSQATASITLGEGSQITCTYANSKVTNSPSISTTLSESTGSIGDLVHDSATLTGATGDAGGTVKYAYYSSLSDCGSGTYASPGGTSAGSVTVTNGVVPDSDAKQFNSAGDFYWRAFYSGDANNNPASSTCSEEHLVIAKNTPTVSTSPILRVRDTVTIGGLASASPYGNLTVKLVDGANCSGTLLYSKTWYGHDNPGGEDAFTGNGSYTTAFVTVHADATLRWCSFYEGDANNATRPFADDNEVVTVDFADASIWLSAGVGFAAIPMLLWGIWKRRRDLRAA